MITTGSYVRVSGFSLTGQVLGFNCNGKADVEFPTFRGRTTIMLIPVGKLELAG